MTVYRRGATFHLRRRVPLRYREVEPQVHFAVSLHTDSERDAKAKAAAVWNEMLATWELRLEGGKAEAEDRLAIAKNLAARRGFIYRPVADVAALPIEEILKRIEATINGAGKIDMAAAEAILGGVVVPPKTVTQALESYWQDQSDKLWGKSPDQIRRAKNPRIKAIQNFVKAVEDKPYLEVTSQDLYAFRRWWMAKKEREGLTANSINKDLVYVTSTLRAVARADGAEVKFKTEQLKIDEGEKVTRPPFSTEWITTKILEDGALDSLNAEARAILLVMVNTGARPSEIAALAPEQIDVESDLPHIRIEAVGRTLKSQYAKRVIPLAGVSLEALKQFPGGFPRYRFNSATLSATVNKSLREANLLPTAKHSLYSLRHSFEDRMLAAGIDERIRRDLMGHALDREKYGAGATLAQLHALIAPIAL